MKAKVYCLPVGDRVNPDGIIEAARNARLARVVIVGWDQDGKMFFSGSESLETTIYMLRNAEHELFRYMDREEA